MKSLLVLFIVFFSTLVEADKLPLSWNDLKLVPLSGTAKEIYRYKSPLLVHRKEWEVGSGIAKDLTDLNLVSFPSAVKYKKGEVRFSALELLNLDANVFAEYYKPYQMSSDMSVWSYLGYDPLTLKPSLDFEIKPVPPLRGRGHPFYAKYEHTEPTMSLKLPRVSKRIALKVFPSLYGDVKKIDYSKEAPNFWKQVLESDIPIVIVEGHKKALSVLSLGIPAIGLLGACKGLRLYKKDGKNKFRVNKSLLKFMTAKKRTFYINFDNDDIEFIRKIIFSVAEKFGRALREYGHTVKVFYSPDNNLKGSDDFIVARGESAYRKLMLKARSLEKFIQDEKPKALEDFLKKSAYSFCFMPGNLQCEVGRRFSKKYPIVKDYKKDCFVMADR